MTSEDYKQITKWLYDGISRDYESSDIRRYAEGAHKLLKGVIASLWAMFDRHICESKEKWLRYADGSLYAYNGRWFERIDDVSFLEELVRSVLSDLGVGDTYRLFGASQIAKPLMGKIKTTPECAYEPDRRWIAFTNGVLDLKNCEFKPKFSINYPTEIVLDFDYNPKANGLLWGIKLKQIIPNDGFRSDFQQFCGSLLADRSVYKNEYVCYLHGGGGNGKSVLADTVALTLGPKYYSTFTLSQIFAKETAALFVVKEMSGKLLNLADDVEDKDISGANFKRFVSGGALPGRGVGKGDWSKVTPPMLLCCINTFPDVADDSEGNHRRQMIVETTKKQWEGTERDTNLTAKLTTTEGRQACFNWMYEGYRKFKANGGAIRFSADGEHARISRREDSSPMRRWANERLYIKASPIDNKDPRWRKLTDLYADYRSYCVENGFRYETDARKIAAMFRSMGIEVKNLNGAGTMACVGILGRDTDENGKLK